MGLDINIGTDNSDEIYSSGYYDDKNDYLNKHSLSRTFCNFMCRQNVIDHEPELDQIGRITGVNISSLYEMENYSEGEELDFFAEFAESDDEIKKLLVKAESKKDKLKGNIDKVMQTLNSLIDKLNGINNLPSLLLATDFDSLGNQEYFSDFQTENVTGYVSNNFGQDLRNFRCFLEFAKSKGSTTVWFNYG